MSQRHISLEDLYEELRTIEVFDRVHEYAPVTDPANNSQYATRQFRRKEILQEIARLKTHKFGLWKPAGLSGAIAVMCAVGYALVYYSLR